WASSLATTPVGCGLTQPGSDSHNGSARPVSAVIIQGRGILVLPQREREEGIARGDSDVLPSIDGVRHRPRLDLAANREPPQKRPGSGVERIEETLAAAAEQEVGRGRQDASVGEVDHLVLPLPIARRRIDGPDRAIAFLFLAEVTRGRSEPRRDGGP